MPVAAEGILYITVGLNMCQQPHSSNSNYCISRVHFAVHQMGMVFIRPQFYRNCSCRDSAALDTCTQNQANLFKMLHIKPHTPSDLNARYNCTLRAKNQMQMDSPSYPAHNKPTSATSGRHSTGGEQGARGQTLTNHRY